MKLKPYPKYKDSGVEWLGEVPAEWDFVRLGFLFDNKKRPLMAGYGVVTAFRDGQVTLRTNRRIDGFTEADKEIGYQGVIPGDLVIHAMDAFAGAIGVSDSEGKMSPVCSVCEPKPGVISRYYGYLMRNIALTGYITSLAKGIRERSTDFRWADARLIPVPVPKNQQQIVTFLDRETAKLDTLIAKQEKLIELLQEKRQAVISHAVTKGLDPDVPMKDSGVEWLGEVPAHWEVKRLKFVAPLSTAKVEASKTNLPYVGMENVESATGKFIDVEDQAEAEGTSNYFRRDDVLFGKLRPYLAKALHVEWEGICSSEFLVLRGVDVLPGFLLRYLLSTELIKQVDSSTYGSKMPRASWDFIGNLPIPVPSKSEQTELIDYLTNESKRFDILIDRAKHSIELAKEHRTALISAAVTGKIDVREAA